MEFKVSPSPGGGYVEVEIVGDVSRAGVGKMVQALHMQGRQTGIVCYLIDATNARNVERPLENVRLTKNDIPAARANTSRTICMALLVTPGDTSHDFFAAFARQQGIDATVFWDRKAAVAHLAKAAPTLNGEPPRSAAG